MSRRRALFLALVASVAAPRLLFAQPKASLPRVAVVFNGSPETHGSYYDGFQQGMRALGYVNQRNVELDVRWAVAQLDRLPAIMAELLSRKPDVMVMAGSQALRAAKAATSTVPIVMAGVADPVAQGLIASLARPGGNITGVAIRGEALMLKGLELMVEAVPQSSRIGVLVNPSNHFHSIAWKHTEAAAGKLGVRLLRFEASSPRELERSLAAIARQKPEALVIGGDALFNSFRGWIAKFAAKNRIPAIQSFADFVIAGGLMSYSPDIADNHRIAATYVHRILNGAKPEDLAVEQPDNFELLVNARTLRMLGITLPQSLIARVDDFID